MATVYFSSLANAEIVEVDLVSPERSIVRMRLLVDSGFTGRSSFVLPRRAANVIQIPVQQSEVTGALSGAQNRGLVICRVPRLSFEETMIAIIADVSTLNLPLEADGIAGLSFLRHFARWGAERGRDGLWRFLLESSSQQFTT